MKSGKVSDTTLRRSILKGVQKVNMGTLLPMVGGGAGSIPMGSVAGGLARAGSKQGDGPETAVFSAMQTVAGEGLATAYLAAVRAANSLAAKGATPQRASIAITVPESMDERDLRRMYERYCDFLRRHNIKIVGGHTAVSAVVTEPVVSVQMFGFCPDDAEKADENPGAKKTGKAEKSAETLFGLDIVMTKHCGLGGTALLAGHFTDEIATRYPRRFVERAAEFLSETEKNEEGYLAVADGAAYVHAAAEGGVFGALWELAEFGECGLEIDLPAIPILQETVEICEFFDVNPYQLRTEGVFLILSGQGNRLCEVLAEKGIPAAVIGKTISGLDRTVRNGEEIRYLEPNRVEEYERVMAVKRAGK